MSNSNKIVSDIVAGNASAAKTQIHTALLQKALTHIDTMKREVGQNFFKGQDKQS